MTAQTCVGCGFPILGASYYVDHLDGSTSWMDNGAPYHHVCWDRLGDVADPGNVDDDGEDGFDLPGIGEA